jgi:hypothetical protein
MSDSSLGGNTLGIIASAIWVHKGSAVAAFSRRAPNIGRCPTPLSVTPASAI